MNILVTGANGQLGNEMRIVTKGSSDKYIFTDVNQVEGLETIYLDITDIDAIRTIVADNDIKAIVNCAAWTNVDACENDEKLAALAEKLNADAPENLAKAIKEVNGLLVQISTDYVFGKEPYTIHLAIQTRKVLLQGYMEQPRNTGKKTFLPVDVITLFFAQPGYTQSSVRTFARQC